MACNRKIRSFLGKNRLLPTSMRRASPDRRIQGERRIRALHEYLAIKGADRRFEPDRRNHIERRAYGFDFESPDDVL
ncbi:MAG: hypothetical protein KKD44_24710 [Proteobacteria bacterium]|nr:hypothetical protein [Pseudomonadota bacterium]